MGISPCSSSFKMQVATSMDCLARSRVISLRLQEGIKRCNIDSNVSFTTARRESVTPSQSATASQWLGCNHDFLSGNLTFKLGMEGSKDEELGGHRYAMRCCMGQQQRKIGGVVSWEHGYSLMLDVTRVMMLALELFLRKFLILKRRKTDSYLLIDWQVDNILLPSMTSQTLSTIAPSYYLDVLLNLMVPKSWKCASRLSYCIPLTLSTNSSIPLLLWVTSFCEPG